MLRALVFRLAGLALTLLVAAALVFFLLDLLPGDPARFMLGINASAETVATLRAKLGLDAPSGLRFLTWIWGALRGDLGTSYSQGVPVASLIADRLPVSLPLAIWAMFLSMLVGLPLGIAAANRHQKFGDATLMGLAQVGVAVPNFWAGMLLVMLFAVWLGWLPSGGFTPWQESPFDAARALLLPGIALALPQAAIIARVMRTALIDIAGADFIRTARAKGLTRRQAMLRHGVRNAFLPVLTILGLQFAFLISGTVIVENVFFLPGLGRLILTAISERDLILVRGVTLVLIASVIAIMALVDILYAIADPRLRRVHAQ